MIGMFCSRPSDILVKFSFIPSDPTLQYFALALDIDAKSLVRLVVVSFAHDVAKKLEHIAAPSVSLLDLRVSKKHKRHLG